MTEQDLAKIEAENEKLKSLCNAKPWYYPVASGLRSATATIDQLVGELRRVQPYAELGKVFENITETFSDKTLPDDKTDAFIEVWQRQNAELSQLRAIKNQLQQELAARPER